jgi:hypothetical protein
MTTHNMDDGFADAFLRGLRSTFLTDMEYANLKEGGNRGTTAGGEKAREDFEDLRLTLQETDYGNFLQAEVRTHRPKNEGGAVERMTVFGRGARPAPLGPRRGPCAAAPDATVLDALVGVRRAPGSPGSPENARQSHPTPPSLRVLVRTLLLPRSPSSTPRSSPTAAGTSG